MNDKSTNPHDLAFMLGGIQSDVKHVLAALTRNQEQFDRIDKEFDHIGDRLNKVEKFNVKVLTMASIIGPVLMVVLDLGLKFIGL